MSRGRMPDSQSREPGFESPLLYHIRSFGNCRSLHDAPVHSAEYMYLAIWGIDSVGNVNEVFSP